MDGAEGWYVDPYGEHEARWFSDGHPTSLIQDGHIEGRDDPPDRPVDGLLKRVESAQDPTANDQRRADDAGSDQPDYSRKAADVANEAIGPWMF